MIYVIVARNGLFKIGETESLQNRVSHIKSTSPVECELFFTCDGGIETEKKLHIIFDSKRIRGEWFALSKEDILTFCPDNEHLKELIEEMYNWGFFELGKLELSNSNGSMAVMYRVNAIQGMLR